MRFNQDVGRAGRDWKFRVQLYPDLSLTDSPSRSRFRYGLSNNGGEECFSFLGPDDFVAVHFEGSWKGP